MPVLCTQYCTCIMYTVMCPHCVHSTVPAQCIQYCTRTSTVPTPSIQYCARTVYTVLCPHKYCTHTVYTVLCPHYTGPALCTKYCAHSVNSTVSTLCTVFFHPTPATDMMNEHADNGKTTPQPAINYLPPTGSLTLTNTTKSHISLTMWPM